MNIWIIILSILLVILIIILLALSIYCKKQYYKNFKIYCSTYLSSIVCGLNETYYKKRITHLLNDCLYLTEQMNELISKDESERISNELITRNKKFEEDNKVTLDDVDFFTKNLDAILYLKFNKEIVKVAREQLDIIENSNYEEEQ